MLHPRFFDMVALAAQQGIDVSTNTNLTLLTEARARRCVTSGLRSLSVSLDGASAAVYESIRVGASFDKWCATWAGSWPPALPPTAPCTCAG